MRAAMARAVDEVGAASLVLQLTASGERAELAAAPLKELSRLCAKDNEALQAAFAALQRRLRAADSRVRLRATLLADHFFRRSKLFRELLTRWLAEFAACAGLTGAPLPLPQSAASRLKALAFTQLQAWVEGWGAHYAELHVALRHAADHAAAAPRALPGSAEAAQARRAARARELARQRYFSFRPSVEPLFVAVRGVLAQLDVAAGPDQRRLPGVHPAVLQSRLLRGDVRLRHHPGIVPRHAGVHRCRCRWRACDGHHHQHIARRHHLDDQHGKRAGLRDQLPICEGAHDRDRQRWHGHL
jgi:hypothetical protein